MPVLIPASSFFEAVRILYDSIGQGLPTAWLDEIPEKQGYPRALLRYHPEVPDSRSYDPGDQLPIFTTSGFTLELSTENSEALANTLAVIVMKAFTPRTLNLRSDANAVIKRTNYTLAGIGERSPAGNPVYTATLTYEAIYSTDH